MDRLSGLDRDPALPTPTPATEPTPPPPTKSSRARLHEPPYCSPTPPTLPPHQSASPPAKRPHPRPCELPCRSLTPPALSPHHPTQPKPAEETLYGDGDEDIEETLRGGDSSLGTGDNAPTHKLPPRRTPSGLANVPSMALLPTQVPAVEPPRSPVQGTSIAAPSSTPAHMPVATHVPAALTDSRPITRHSALPAYGSATAVVTRSKKAPPATPAKKVPPAAVKKAPPAAKRKRNSKGGKEDSSDESGEGDEHAMVAKKGKSSTKVKNKVKAKARGKAKDNAAEGSSSGSPLLTDEGSDEEAEPNDIGL